MLLAPGGNGGVGVVAGDGVVGVAVCGGGSGTDGGGDVVDTVVGGGGGNCGVCVV